MLTRQMRWIRCPYSKYLAEKQEADADETRREVVKELLQKLPESERTVMTLHYLGEMTIKALVSSSAFPQIPSKADSAAPATVCGKMKM